MPRDVARVLTRGHVAAVAAVQRAIERERPPHALLLLGPDGIGKTTLALDLAAGLLCADPDPAARPCRACPACRKVEHGNHPDLHRLVPEGAGGQIRLAQVQALTADLALLPMEGRTRVALIEDAHRLNPDAQNALLKVLEEPTGASCMILVADDSATLLPTVLSRTQRLRLGPVPPAVIADILVERGLADPSRARTLASLADGRPGLAVALAREPESVLVQARLARGLLDLLRADRRRRLAAIPDLVAAGAALDEALHGEAGFASVPEGAAEPTPPSAGIDGGAEPAPRPRRPSRGTATGAPRATQSRRPQPAERRRAALRVIAAWRDLGRDLAVAARGGTGEVRHLDLLEELMPAANAVDFVQLLAFLERLDGLGAAIEAYANPELVLDSLVLGWPHLRGPE